MSNNLITDAEGYLQESSDWTESVALHIALAENVHLTEAHWEILRFLRDFYPKNNSQSPGMRVLMKVLRNSLGETKGSSIYFHQLFPKGAGQAAKIAGLPKPLRCVI
jgi:tRNA 2-thiouridine synthesizing protein E